MNDDRQIKPKIIHIVITGASSGIGAALAKVYAINGAHLYLTGRDEKRLNDIAEVCRSLSADVTTKCVDVTDREAIRDWLTQIPQIDLIIANAGMAIPGTSPKDHDYEDKARQIFDVNLTGVLNSLHPAISKMQHQGFGHIAAVSSLAGYRGLPTAPAYSASKAAVKAYVEALAPSLKEQNIHTSVIFPGFVRSRITDSNDFSMPFFMEADQAAQVIKDAISKKKRIIAFPWPMRFVSWIFRALPSSLALWMLSFSKETKG